MDVVSPTRKKPLLQDYHKKDLKCVGNNLFSPIINFKKMFSGLKEHNNKLLGYNKQCYLWRKIMIRVLTQTTLYHL